MQKQENAQFYFSASVLCFLTIIVCFALYSMLLAEGFSINAHGLLTADMPDEFAAGETIVMRIGFEKSVDHGRFVVFSHPGQDGLIKLLPDNVVIPAGQQHVDVEITPYAPGYLEFTIHSEFQYITITRVVR